MNGPLAVAVLGAGSWGTTLANLVARNGHATLLYTRDPNQRDEINVRRTNARSLGDVALAPGLRATSELAEAVREAELVLIAVPSQSFRAVVRRCGELLRPDHMVVHGTKGLEMKTLARMSEILLDETAVRQLGVVGGPNIAPEVAAGKPAGTVIASPFPHVIEAVRRALSSEQMMVFAGSDMLGVELCGALKNVVAIAAGIADELNVGDNAKAFLVTRGIAELMRLAFAMGAEPMTMAGLAGIGDLMVTCSSKLSRNHRVGVALARGEKLEDAVARLGMVAEGVYASIAAKALAERHGIEIPLFDRIERVLHHGLSPHDAIDELMRLPAGRDAPRFAARPWRAAFGRSLDVQR